MRWLKLTISRTVTSTASIMVSLWNQLFLGLSFLSLPAQAKPPTKPLVPYVYNAIPLGSITPNGWLRRELQTEANGLAGHLHDFWGFVHNSSWLGGGSEYSKLNEAFPYWLNGLVPLAYVLDDARLKEQVHSAMDYLMVSLASYNHSWSAANLRRAATYDRG
jgi:hypothetical protein